MLLFAATSQHSSVQRLRLRVRGVVQGVGFRPFVFRLAQSLQLSGFVLNDGEGVLIEIEGAATDRFQALLRDQAPPLARVDSIELTRLAPRGGGGFTIARSGTGSNATRIGADAAVCAECLRDMADPGSRFFAYAFTHCTHCGPRFTITRGLPYDRERTSMAGFAMCPACQGDYADPASRRFHAEAIACPDCGPRLSSSIEDAAAWLAHGGIVALKGVGGFHLLCDARDDAAVGRLRARKARDAKPFAVMVRDLVAARRIADPTPAEEALLASTARPIVLARARPSALSPHVAPRLSRVGLVLAYAPAHYLLFDALSRLRASPPPALVATSANPGGEPLVADNDEARTRLRGIADFIVSHDREIVARADDSVMQVVAGMPAFIRRARGFVPDPIDLGADGPAVIATGADLKNTVCVTRGREAFLSPHVGGLDNAQTIRFQRETMTHLCAILGIEPEFAACDLHPDFHSTRAAESLGLPLIRVQHHLAHAQAVVAEHGLRERVLGVVMDGYGFGLDGAAWGGELLLVDGPVWKRAGALWPLPMPGGDRAAREPWRMGVAALHEAGCPGAAPALWPDHAQASRLAALLASGMRAPRTHSLGRLFDAAAAISGGRLVQSHEGQAAMEFEAWVTAPESCRDGYAIENGLLDFRGLVHQMATAGLKGRAAANLFHGTVIDGLVQWAVSAAVSTGTDRVVLAGGCFMNRVLAEGAMRGLERHGLAPFIARQAPANDGGIALGQAAWARQVIMGGSSTQEHPACVYPFPSR